MKVYKSTRKGKKYMVIYNNKKIHFGAEGMSDYTINKDPKRKAAYIARHRKNEDWTDPSTAGFYSKHILWNTPNSVAYNMRLTEKRFNI
tara:strand:+ start:989 stop:1255 length:267 start_codon:yes stop_codon:yes gene_type:complete